MAPDRRTDPRRPALATSGHAPVPHKWVPRREAEAPSGPASGLVTVLVPVYEDWESVAVLLPLLDKALAGERMRARVLLVDDGSPTPAPEDLEDVFPEARAIQSVDVLRLRRNLGHQRAIAVGLAFVAANLPCRAVVVMDGDGEDKPGDVPRLARRAAECGGERIVFAERTRRSENRTFRVFYQLYRLLHRALTGIGVRVGNFSYLPYGSLQRLVVCSELWNHYAAAIHKAKLPFELVPTERGHRFAGEGRMDFTALVTHGLSAISVFSDRVGVRMLLSTLVLGLASVAGTGLLLLGFVATGYDVPAWMASASALLVVALLQMLLLSVFFVFTILMGRKDTGFLPTRDHAFFVERLDRVFAAHG